MGCVASPVCADPLAAVAGISEALQCQLDPNRFLDELAWRVRPFLPHDRLLVEYLEEGGRTFTVFAEHDVEGRRAHEGRYTTDFNPEGRYPAAEPVFAGEPTRIEDAAGDPRLVQLRGRIGKVGDVALRSWLLVPLRSGGRVIGALAAASRSPGRYLPAHVELARRVADLTGPLIENTVLLRREERRRQRLEVLDRLIRGLATTPDAWADLGARLHTAGSVIDFDAAAVALKSPNGRDPERLVTADRAPLTSRLSWLPPDTCSFRGRLDSGESVLVADAEAELDPSMPGDRAVLDSGARSLAVVPLWLGELVGGCVAFAKSRPHWFDSSDLEIGISIATCLGLAIQHQRLAEERCRVAVAGVPAKQVEAGPTERPELSLIASHERFGSQRIVGQAPALREALALAVRVAPSDATVLITGESGTGKEGIARAIHSASRRAARPFVAVNCTTLPETLLESELFGHERGAFTGADRRKPGRFELAAGGSLFLDEVAELPLAMQPKLLRVLQEREFERVGGTATLRADVRVIAATNVDLAERVADGRFRIDLYYRLNVVNIHLPSLRERGDDVLLLAEHFVRMFCEQMGKPQASLSRDARDALLAHRWPGNIRELQNAIQRALLLSDGTLIARRHLGLAQSAEPQPARAAIERPADGMPAAEGASLAACERACVLDALRKARGNKSEAARALGISRTRLYTRLRRFGILDRREPALTDEPMLTA